jgi:hypothetical protein
MDSSKRCPNEGVFIEKVGRGKSYLTKTIFRE